MLIKSLEFSFVFFVVNIIKAVETNFIQNNQTRPIKQYNQQTFAELEYSFIKTE